MLIWYHLNSRFKFIHYHSLVILVLSLSDFMEAKIVIVFKWEVCGVWKTYFIHSQQIIYIFSKKNAGTTFVLNKFLTFVILFDLNRYNTTIIKLEDFC